MPKCEAMTVRGTPCRANALTGMKYCRTHNDAEHDESDADSQMKSKSSSEVRTRTPSQETENVSDSTNVSETLDSLNEKVAKLEKLLKATATSVLNDNKPKAKKAASKGPRKMTDKTAMIKARWIYYNEMKDTNEVVSAIRGGLIQGNMLKTKKVTMENGEVVDKEQIPYQLKKMYTDMKFDSMSDSKKKKYIKMAWEQHAEKVAEAEA